MECKESNCEEKIHEAFCFSAMTVRQRHRQRRHKIGRQIKCEQILIVDSTFVGVGVFVLCCVALSCLCCVALPCLVFACVLLSYSILCWLFLPVSSLALSCLVLSEWSCLVVVLYDLVLTCGCLVLCFHVLSCLVVVWLMVVLCCLAVLILKLNITLVSQALQI